jgi:glycosyltransferase involved in cell wall biosynthesis
MIDVLLVAYHYPPISSAGTQRAVSFAQHLPHHGYRVHVLTTNAFGSPSPDSAYRAGELVGGYRTLFNPKARDLPSHLRSRTRTGSGQGSLLSQLGRRLLVPDAQVGWLPSAYRVARSILNAHPVRIVLTTGPPFSSHLLGSILHKTTNLPWVADFRDTWTHDPLDEVINRPVRGPIERWMERSVLEMATRVTCVTDVAADLFAQHTARPVTVIPNGYEPRSDPAHTLPEGGPIRFVHTGSFAASHPRRSPEPLVQAAQMVGENVDFKLVFVGPLNPKEMAMIQPLVDSGKAETTGAVSSEEALAWQDRADVLVVVDHPRDVLASNIPGKVYEYGASGKPILAIVPPGATDRLLKGLDTGVCVGHKPEEIALAIKEMAGDPTRFSSDQSRWAQFERCHSARKMADLLGDVLSV